MKKRIFLVLFSIFTAFSGFSQVGVSPEDDFYTDVVSWQLQGIVYYVPQIRPYSLNAIKSILLRVFENGNADSIKKAQYYYEKFFGKKWKIHSEISATEVLQSIQDLETVNNEKYSARLYTSGDFDFGKLFSLSYNVGVNGFNVNDNKNLLNPYATYDSSKVINNGFSVKNDDLALTFDVNAVGTIGIERNYLSFGINKFSYGPFSDSSISLNSQSAPFLNLSYQFTGKYVSYSQILGAISAKSSTEQNQFKMDKFFAFHALKIPFFSKEVHLSLYETSVFGKSFMPQYILPSPFFVMSAVGGFNENTLFGLLFEWNIVKSLKFNFNFNLDDCDIKQVLKLKLDSGIRSALQIGFEYAPEDSLCNLITLDYSLVTPYTYTYYEKQDEYNYRDVSNLGIPMAANIKPNSDRISLKINFKPKNNFKIATKTTFIRHANSFESLTDDEVLSLKGKSFLSDGSLYASDLGLDTTVNYTNFLKQSSIMYSIQGSVDFDYTFNLSKNQNLTIFSGYFFEFIKNDGVDSNIYKGTESTTEEVQKSLSDWKSNFKDRYNHYFSIGVKYSY